MDGVRRNEALVDRARHDRTHQPVDLRDRVRVEAAAVEGAVPGPHVRWSDLAEGGETELVDQVPQLRHIRVSRRGRRSRSANHDRAKVAKLICEAVGSTKVPRWMSASICER